MASDDFEGVLANRFASAFRPSEPASQTDERVAKRKDRERRSTRTPAQRARAAKRTKLVNFKTTPEMAAQLQALAASMGTTMTQVLELGIGLVARQNTRKTP